VVTSSRPRALIATMSSAARVPLRFDFQDRDSLLKARNVTASGCNHHYTQPGKAPK